MTPGDGHVCGTPWWGGTETGTGTGTVTVAVGVVVVVVVVVGVAWVVATGPQ